MRTDTQRQRNWSGNMEQLEDRMVMSADPLGGLLGGSVQHHAIVDDLPALEHQVVAEEPPALDQHIQSDADFWIDHSNLRAIEEELGQIEQSLANAHDQSGMSQVRANYGFDGTGQTVAVIDSGIAYDHFALGGGLGSNYRVVGGWDFTGENDANPYDDGGAGSHGTHVSGIIGASGGDHEGVAPGVDLVGLRVFDDAGDGYFSWVEDALQWVHDNRNSFENPITAVNLSLGVATWNSDAIPSWANLENEFNLLKQDGIFISVSAGNSFTSFNSTGLSYPAASPHVVPVASVDDNGQLSYYSQRNDRVIAAPGRGIISTVPDYKGDNNGTTDDYASFSGTSMAAPYVAGASVIIREAMEFVGYTNITQQTIYDHMIATADSFYDSATDANYNRLNLESAIDALMPTDDYGSSIGTAYDLGTVSSASSMSGAITTLDDIDYFKFTAASNGTVEFNASSMSYNVSADWSVSGGTGTWSGANNETLTIDVVAGQEYTVGFSSDDGLGYYDLDITAESSLSYTDWGSISFTENQGISNTGDTWYRVAANDAGYFTAEAMFDAGGGQVSLELYDAGMQLVDTGNPANGLARVDVYAAANQELFLKVSGSNSDIDFRLTNLVSIDGTTVNVAGTTGDDAFTFAAGSTHELSVNGVSYSFNSVSVADFDFNGGAGSDSVELTGTAGDETALLLVGNAELSGVGYEVSVLNVEDVSVVGSGGTDLAYLYDSSGDDLLLSSPTTTQMTGEGFDHTVQGFSRVNAYATGGGYDLAKFYDSAGDDRYIASAEYSEAYLYGDGYLNYSLGFDRTEAYAVNGGNDRAYFYDSSGDDRFISSAQYHEAYMYGDGYLNYAQGFSRNYAYANAGGSNDRADFYDSQGNDIYVVLAEGDAAYLVGDGYLNYSNGFGRTTAYATEGGSDRAYFYDSSGDDRYVSSGEYLEAYLYSDSFLHYTKGFGRTDAFATAGGHDRAYFYDSAGNDRFISSGQNLDAYMYGDGFLNYAQGFDRNYGYATAGGTKDRADFYDSAGDDQYVSNAEQGDAYMVGGGFLNYTLGFDRTYAYSLSGGNDLASFYDSLGDDVFQVSTNSQSLYGNGVLSYAEGFGQTNAYSSQGYDQAIIDTLLGDESLYGLGNLASVSRPESDQNLYDFDKVTATLDGASVNVDMNAIDYAYEELGV